MVVAFTLTLATYNHFTPRHEKRYPPTTNIYLFENTLQKAFTFVIKQFFGVMLLDVELSVDGEAIDLSEFVVKILGGTLVGAVTSLRGIKKDWKKIEVKVTR